MFHLCTYVYETEQLSTMKMSVVALEHTKRVSYVHKTAWKTKKEK